MKGKILKCKLGVRYWENSTIDGIEDVNGDLIPGRMGDYWCPEINVQIGQIINWEMGKVADIHYKVCDDGEYELLDDRGYVIVSNDSYVPDCLSPKAEGYGDYVIMNVNEEGLIERFVDNYNETKLVNYLRDE
jgi:hypothetical protein